MNRLHASLLVPLGLLVVLAASASAQTVYTNDFASGAGSEWSNPATSVSNGERFLASSPNGFGAGTDTLTLAGLPSHDTLTIVFDFYAIQSWDGNGQQGGGPDNFGVALDGVARYLTNFANYTGGNTQAYPNQLAPFGAGGDFAPRTGALENGHLGYGTGDFGDSTYRITLSLPHTASTAAFAFTSTQTEGVGNEGWGLDNVSVVASGAPVPEPASLCALGVGAIALLRRRRI